VIVTAAIKARFEALEPVLDERESGGCSRPVRRVRPDMAGSLRNCGRRGLRAARLIAAPENLRSGAVMFQPAGSPTGGGGKPATEAQPGLLEALNDLVQSAVRGDPEGALVWVSKSQRHLSAALADLGFGAGQKLVGRLLKRLGLSLQANAKTREGTSHPDCNAQHARAPSEASAVDVDTVRTISWRIF
jgi:hypothetical protein